MITKKKIYGSMQNICEMFGLSTDSKPMDVCNASTFYEMDTKKLFLFDAQNKVWLEQ